MSTRTSSPGSLPPVAERPGGAWRVAGREPALDEVLADPVVHLVMRRDGVSLADLERVVAAAQAKLRRGLWWCCAA